VKSHPLIIKVNRFQRVPSRCPQGLGALLCQCGSWPTARGVA